MGPLATAEAKRLAWEAAKGVVRYEALGAPCTAAAVCGRGEGLLRGAGVSFDSYDAYLAMRDLVAVAAWSRVLGLDTEAA